MFKQGLLLVVVLCLFWASNVHGAVIDSNWVTIDNDGLWRDANNWNPQIVPDNNGATTFAVTIDSRSGWWIEINFDEHGDEKSYKVDTINCYGDVEFESTEWWWTVIELAHPNGLTNYGVLLIDGIDIGGNITNMPGAILEFEEDGLAMVGDLYNMTGGEVIFKATFRIDDGGNLINNGVINILRGAKLKGKTFFATPQVSNSNRINLNGAEITNFYNFLNDPNGNIEGSGAVYVVNSLNNEGTIQSYSGSLELRSDNAILNTGILTNKPGSTLNISVPGSFTNQGTITVNSSGAINCQTNIVNDSSIELLGGTLSAPVITQSTDANFSGFGTIAADLILEPAADINITGPTNIVGDVNIPTSATLKISDGTTLITGHTTCNNGTIHMKGGRVIPQGGFTNNDCNIIWEPGTYNNIADFNLDGQVNFEDFADFADTWLWLAQL